MAENLQKILIFYTFLHPASLDRVLHMLYTILCINVNMG